MLDSAVMASNLSETLRRAASICALVSGLLTAAACATPPRPLGVEVLIKASDARLTMNAAGARLLSEASGCTVQFRQEGAVEVGLFLVAPPSPAVSTAECMRRIAGLPTVAYVVENTAMRELRARESR